MCNHPMRHRGKCLADVIEDVQFLAEQDGIPLRQTKVGYPAHYRVNLAERLGMTPAALDQALYRRARVVA